MILHYLKVSLRRLRRDGLYGVINVLGLSLGLTASMLIFLYMHHEWRYDRQHDDVSSVYRVTWPNSARTGKPMAGSLKEEFPEIEAAVLMISYRIRVDDAVW